MHLVGPYYANISRCTARRIVKFSNAQEAKQLYQYKNIKEKPYNTNAAIWYKTTGRQKQLTPSCISIKINGNNPQCRKTIKAARHYSLNQELKFLYVKKQKKLNEPLYKIHLECASSWQNNWHLIQSSTDKKLQRQMETYYIHLNKTLDRLQAKQRQQTRTSHNNQEQQQFYPQNKNLTNIELSKEENYGLQYCTERPLRLTLPVS